MEGGAAGRRSLTSFLSRIVDVDVQSTGKAFVSPWNPPGEPLLWYRPLGCARPTFNTINNLLDSAPTFPYTVRFASSWISPATRSAGLFVPRRGNIRDTERCHRSPPASQHSECSSHRNLRRAMFARSCKKRRCPEEI